MSSEEQEEKTSFPPEEEEKLDVKPPAPSGEAETIGKKEVEIPDCPVHSVVVYPDRAEVCNVANKVLLQLLSLHLAAVELDSLIITL